MEKYDFSGWATKYNRLCSDGRTIMNHAFDDVDGQRVPLVWMHQHDSPFNVIGHADLESRPEGVYAYCKFNDTDAAEHAHKSLGNGDLNALSIYANKLKQKNGNVFHGVIREVSLVLSGANPEAVIDYPVIEHSDGSYEEEFTEAVIWSGEEVSNSPIDADVIKHADEPNKKEEEKMAESNEEMTVQEVYDSLTEDQKDVVNFLIGQAVADATGSDEDDDEDDYDYDDEDDDEMEQDAFGGDYMKHNVFDVTYADESDELSHDAMETMIADGKRYGSLKESVLAHAEDYGIDGIEWLFPEDRNLNTTPELIKRDTDWVSVVMSGVHHTPFSRVKSTFANITEDEARAKGYLKGHLKKEEVFSLLKRSTTPQTVYKKQKIDRDDQIDITDFDVVAWLKKEMRMMLDEELARAYLIGDGRLASDDDKISEEHIRPIANDADLFTIKKAVTLGTGAAADDITARNFIKTAIKARKDYKGSGNPTLFTTEDQLTNMLLLEDTLGHSLYKTEQELATKLRVSRIVTVPVMENHQVNGKTLMGIIVNLADYNVGADKGGAINMFEDFDIDYNQEKYLIETRCSGALTKPYSAIVLFASELPTSVDGGVVVSKTTYTQVSPAGTENPKALGWYEYDASTGKYVKTTDTTVDQSATYYTRKSFNAD